MELLEVKKKVDDLLQSVTEVAQEINRALKETKDDSSVETQAKKITFIMITGGMLCLLSCLQSMKQNLEVADVHERHRGDQRVTGMTV